MNGSIEQEYALWDDFLELFPISRLKDLSIEEYSEAGAKDTFTWWLESGLDTLGSIWGATAFKFGIYARANNDRVFKSKQYRSDDQYAWQAKWGITREEAFIAVKSAVLEVAEAARIRDLERIEKSPLSSMYKWKITHIYQDREKPVALNIFKSDPLRQYLKIHTRQEVPPKTSLATLYQRVFELREGLDLLEFGSKVWSEASSLSAYSKLKESFLNHYPGFTTFSDPTDLYLQQERNYKQELCDIFSDEFAPRLHPLVPGDELIQLGKDISALFVRKLVSENAPQNLVGWRYFEFRKTLDDKGFARFATAVSQLTDENIALAKRIPEFVAFLHNHSPDGRCGQAATRSLTTFFLYLSNPHRHFFIKTEEIIKLLDLFDLETFNNDDLAPEEYNRVLTLADTLFQLLKEDGLEPLDMTDVQSFVWSGLHSMQTAQTDDKAQAVVSHEPTPLSESTMSHYPLNQILYGPPGTGKTYLTAQYAVEICDGTVPENRTELMERYRQLIAEKRISFVSFHQSFSYEEFIEGIRPDLTEQTDSEQEQLFYKIEDGLFKKVCAMAQTAIDDLKRPISKIHDLASKSFYKMSVGGKDDPHVETFCFDNGYISMGYGSDIDYSILPKDKKWASSSAAIKDLMIKHGTNQAQKKYAIQAMYWFKDGMDVGDIFIVPKGISKVQAIGQVTGEYEYQPEFIPGRGYNHFRKVKWLILNADIPTEKIWSKQISPATIYNLNPAHLEMDYLRKLLNEDQAAERPAEPERFVLIIDEINRANISKVLGELITLIESDKRLGSANEVTVKLPYSREEFGVPGNLHILGTMNTADRSLALMDTALRRRFEFVEMMPDCEVLKGLDIAGISIELLLKTMNERIEVLYDREHTIGHAFFIPLKYERNIETLASIFEHKIIPLLAEYFFEDWQKIRLVLGDNQKAESPNTQFIIEEELIDNGGSLFGDVTDLAIYGLDRRKQYTRNKGALTDPDAYIGIYDSASLVEA